MDQERLHLSPAAYRRRRQIEECLFENLQHTPYASISVSDLCRQVGISRKAYYKYYKDKDDCMGAVLDRFLHAAMLRTTAPEAVSLVVNYTEFLEFWKEHRILLDIIVRDNLLGMLTLRSVSHVQTEDRAILQLLSLPQMPCDEDILACYLSSQMALILQWYLRDFQDPPQKMAEKMIRILHRALIPLE